MSFENIVEKEEITHLILPQNPSHRTRLLQIDNGGNNNLSFENIVEKEEITHLILLQNPSHRTRLLLFVFLLPPLSLCNTSFIASIVRLVKPYKPPTTTTTTTTTTILKFRFISFSSILKKDLETLAFNDCFIRRFMGKLMFKCIIKDGITV